MEVVYFEQTNPNYRSAHVAAEILELSVERVKQLCQTKVLRARKTMNGKQAEWEIEAASIEEEYLKRLGVS